MNNRDGPKGVLTDNDRDIFVFTAVVLLLVVAIFGLFSNTVNILVFRKHGFKDSMSVTLFSLCISDILFLLFLIPTSAIQFPGFASLSRAAGSMYGYRQAIGQCVQVSRLVSVWTTVLVTLERCLCIVKPLSVKQIFTPRRSMAAILAVSCLLLLPTAMTVSLFYAEKGRRLPVVFLAGESNVSKFNITGAPKTPGPANVYQSIVFGLRAVCNLASFLAVLVSMVYLAAMLRKRSPNVRGSGNNRGLTPAPTTATGNNKRSAKVYPIGVLPSPQYLAPPRPASPKTCQQKAASSSRETHIETQRTPECTPAIDIPSTSHQASSPSAAVTETDCTESSDSARRLAQGGGSNAIAASADLRTRRLGRMVLVLSCVNLLCFLPAGVCLGIGLVEPQFRSQGRYGNIFQVVWICLVVLDALNASTNIFVYYRMSSNYRQTLDKMLGMNRH
ncbi:hypothetical protein EGW08_011012 [Elysia chlorotica]|uniref:G-protein coupled receptors family 1 profile domain-containing protein n=1 Tax=Elysia chlorotica TaxID=188477 RepID=A0A3S1BD56_ELYCH|nr:hypothetical protein EGW08_011012 [Elysia chlorotica]